MAISVHSTLSSPSYETPFFLCWCRNFVDRRSLSFECIAIVVVVVVVVAVVVVVVVVVFECIAIRHSELGKEEN